MVSLSDIRASNRLVSSTLPSGLVAVFVGATSGIGEATLKQFANHSNKPRIYFLGRSQFSGDRIVAECRMLNPNGDFIFIQADVSLIRIVDEVCQEIEKKEKEVNLLFLSAGVPSFDRSETTEHLHLLAALNYYSRTRFITNLAPLLQRASVLSRVVSVGGGGKEGELDSSDFPACRVPLTSMRGHLTTLISLGLEATSKITSGISFVHSYPGTVDTGLAKRMTGIRGVIIRAYILFLGYWICVPLEESGERHLYLATSARYPSKDDDGRRFAVPLGEGVNVARGTTGKTGSGVYSIGWDGESSSVHVERFLANLRDRGMVEEVWRHTENEFERIMH